MYRIFCYAFVSLALVHIFQVEGGAERPVSVVNKAQCCGSLKSGVCSII